MAIADALLYHAAKRLYRTEIAHTEEMKRSLSDMDAYDRFRSAEADKVIARLKQYGIDIRGRTVVDFGCNDGALSGRYLREGAGRVIGLDIDAKALDRARLLQPAVTFLQSGVDRIPLDDASIDVLVSFDVFEHVAQPLPILREIHRILRPGGQVLIGTIGWRMPFAPHLWATMPVPWAHVLTSERSLLRACRRVYHSPWYTPNMHDLDAAGHRLADKYTADRISRDYLNHYLVRDFERAFRDVGFNYRTHVQAIGGLAPLKPLCRVPWVREFVGSAVWFVLARIN